MTNKVGAPAKDTGGMQQSVYLLARQVDKLKILSEKEGISISAILQRIIDEYK